MLVPFRNNYAIRLDFDNNRLSAHWVRNLDDKKIARGAQPETVRIAAGALADYFAGRSVRLPFMQRPGLTHFQQMVCEVVYKIPAGEVLTYGEVAVRTGHPGAARAVGSVMARNTLPVFIPCHRVVPATGGLGNYTEYPELKKMLLDHERSTQS